MRALLPIVVVLLVGLLAGVAQAQDSAATEHDEQARAYFKTGAFALAATEFIAAYEIEGTPTRLFNAALAYEKGNEELLASEFYGRYLEVDPDGDRAKEARARKAAIDLALAETKTQGVVEAGPDQSLPTQDAPPGRAHVRATFPGEIEIDGRRTGHLTPYILNELTPGNHSLRVLAAGRVGTAEVLIESGKTALVDVDFAGAEAGGVGEIRIAATNATRAVGYLDGKRIGVLPQLLTEIPSGTHELRIEHPNFTTRTQQVIVPQNDLVEISVQLVPRPKHQLGLLLSDRVFNFVCKSVSGPDGGGEEDDPCQVEGEEGSEHSVGLAIRYVLRHSQRLGFRAALGFHVGPHIHQGPLAEKGFGFIFALGEELRLPLGAGPSSLQVVLAADLEALTYDEARPHQLGFVGSAALRAWSLEFALNAGAQASRSFNNDDHGFSASAGGLRLGASFGGHWLF